MTRSFGLRSLVLSFTAVFQLFSQPFALADDKVAAFQQDIVYAKQKNQEVTLKIDAASKPADEETAGAYEAEAQRLLKELVDKKEAADKLTLLTEESPKEYKEKPVFLKNILMADKRPRNLILGVPASAPKKPQPPPASKKPFLGLFGYGKEKETISDAEALYKVAVSDNKVTVKEAVDIGLANNVQLEAARKRVEVAEARLAEAKRAFWPTLQAAYDLYYGRAPQTFERYLGRSYKLNMTQPLFDGGELKLTAKQAEAGIRSARQDYEKAKGEIVLQIETAYYGVVKAEYNAQYQTDVYAEVEPIYKKAREAHRQKVISEVDFLNVESQYQQVYFQAETSHNDLLSADLILRRSMNLGDNQPVPVDLKLNFVKLTPTLDDLSQLAMKNNPDIRLRELAVEAAEYGIGIYKAKKFPKVELRGSLGKLGEAEKDTIDNPGSGIDDYLDIKMRKEWFLGVQSSVPIGANSLEYGETKNSFAPTITNFAGQGLGSEEHRRRLAFNFLDKLSDITDEKTAQAVYLQAQGDLDKAKDEVVLRLKDQLYTVQKSLIQIDSSVARIRYQEKQNRVLQYLVGLQENPISSYVEGLIEQSQNKFSFIQAVADYHLAFETINVTVGEPDYFRTRS